MATFVSLVNWTDQGIRSYRDTTKRADAFTELVERHGGSVKGIWWTLGEYDIVAIGETPDAETYTALTLELGAMGSVRTQTLQAFDRTEIEQIIAKTS
jgi:uncharacterized protein with GYD domain